MKTHTEMRMRVSITDEKPSIRQPSRHHIFGHWQKAFGDQLILTLSRTIKLGEEPLASRGAVSLRRRHRHCRFRYRGCEVSQVQTLSTVTATLISRGPYERHNELAVVMPFWPFSHASSRAGSTSCSSSECPSPASPVRRPSPLPGRTFEIQNQPVVAKCQTNVTRHIPFFPPFPDSPAVRSTSRSFASFHSAGRNTMRPA